MDTLKDRPHSAKFLILVGPQTAHRALLFNHRHRYLSEVIDDQDGMLVDTLLLSGQRCSLPAQLRLEGIVPAAQLSSTTVQCFVLGEAASPPRELETAGSGA